MLSGDTIMLKSCWLFQDQKLVNLIAVSHLPPAGLIDTDVHLRGDGDVKRQQAIAAGGKGRQLSLHASGEPVRAVLAHINLAEVP